ncbi:hypothetical protein AALP_AA1G147300 [Arabis alpina]|uniref:Uncharacterized protein n=1 Tax=Arabis alpina TaxID=50452 RepID=A0A087HN98_ARAAL|nr:hypothetical protein AALP_AA1G147300 [Arabis alpina]
MKIYSHSLHQALSLADCNHHSTSPCCNRCHPPPPNHTGKMEKANVKLCSAVSFLFTTTAHIKVRQNR